MKLSDTNIGLDDLEKYRYFSKRESSRKILLSRYKINGKIYFFKDKCESCGEPFLFTNLNSVNCSRSCDTSGKNNPFYGKKHTDETKEKLSKFQKEWLKTHKHPTEDIEVRKKISDSKKGEKHPFFNKLGVNSANWKGGYHSKGIPTYDTYAHQLEWTEEVRRNKEDPNVLEVRCFKCKEWYTPSWNNISNRIQHLKGNYTNSNHFYCSKECKNSCSIFGKSAKTLMKEDAIRAGRLSWLELSREIQPELRQMVLERDEYKCVKCNDSNNLECHHIYPVNIEPLLSADIDNCITLCAKCHVKVHKEIDGCNYNQLHIEEC